MRHRSRALIVMLLSMGILAMTLATASGYIEQKLSQVLLSGPNVVKCNRTATVTAQVIATKSGIPLKNQIVHWSLAQTQSSSDGLSAASTITNERGKTSVNISFGPAAGPRVIRATAGGSAPTITVRCSGGLPKTSTVPPADFGELPMAAPLAAPRPVTAAVAALPATGIRMERLGISLPLVEGDGFDVPDGAAAHYPGTAWPGEGSNTYVYAHARAGHFLELWQVRTGDRIEVEMADGSSAPYEVTQIHPMVAWDALEYLAPTEQEVLTLQTCLTYEETAPRFVVIAEPASGA